MRLCFILCFVAVIWSTEARRCKPEDQLAVTQKCIGKTHASEIDLLDLLALKPARTDNAKCFRSCLLQECDYINTRGRVSKHFAQDTALVLSGGDPDKAKRIETTANECIASEKFHDNLCQFAEDLVVCVLHTCKNCGLVLPDGKW